MLDKKLKQKIVNKFKMHDTDTGSSSVQIAILSEEIKQLADHLKIHKKDNSSRRGLLKKVSERRKLLKYLQKENKEAFEELAKKLKLDIAKKMVEDEIIEEQKRQEILDEKIRKEEEAEEKIEAMEEKDSE